MIQSLYIGTYTSHGSEGIYHARFDKQTGEIKDVTLAAQIQQPSFLAIHPNGRWLYAVSETNNPDDRGGEVSAFEIDRKTGALQLINRLRSLGGYPCYVSIDRNGESVMVANYGGGNVTLYPIADDGKLIDAPSFHQHQGKSINPKRQEGPHAHSIRPYPGGDWMYAADLGIDQLLIYRHDREAKKLVPGDPASAPAHPGAGPRHFDFHPNGKYLYVANELDSTVTVFAIAPDSGALSEIQRLSTLPDQFKGDNTCADIHIHPAGDTLYVSNRGHDSIAIFRVDPSSGRLTVLGHASTLGRTPRNFTVHPEGRYLLVANQDSDQIVVFSIVQEAGKRYGTLMATGIQVSVSRPVCLAFLEL